MGCHDVGALRRILAATGKWIHRRVYGRNSFATDPRAGLPKGTLPAPNDRRRRCRLDRNRIPQLFSLLFKEISARGIEAQ
jgi:hypothetical protein